MMKFILLITMAVASLTAIILSHNVGQGGPIASHARSDRLDNKGKRIEGPPAIRTPSKSVQVPSAQQEVEHFKILLTQRNEGDPERLASIITLGSLLKKEDMRILTEHLSSLSDEREASYTMAAMIAIDELEGKRAALACRGARLAEKIPALLQEITTKGIQ